MRGYNHVTLVGNVVRDCELKDFGTSKKAWFTLAINKNYKKGDEEVEADFIPVIAWGKLAEICVEFIGKGRRVLVDGRLQTRSYETAEGEKRTSVEVVADEITLLSSNDKPQ